MRNQFNRNQAFKSKKLWIVYNYMRDVLGHRVDDDAARFTSMTIRTLNPNFD